MRQVCEEGSRVECGIFNAPFAYPEELKVIAYQCGIYAGRIKLHLDEDIVKSIDHLNDSALYV